MHTVNTIIDRLPKMKDLIVTFLLLMLLVGITSGRHLNLTPINREYQAVSEKEDLVSESQAIIDNPLVKSQDDNSANALLVQQSFESDESSPDKQFGGSGIFGNGLIGRLWDRITKRNKRMKIRNFFRRKSNFLLHAASFGTSIAALSTAIAVGSSAAHTAENHLHQVELADEFILEPIFQGKSDVHRKPLVDRVFGPTAY